MTEGARVNSDSDFGRNRSKNKLLGLGLILVPLIFRPSYGPEYMLNVYFCPKKK